MFPKKVECEFQSGQEVCILDAKNIKSSVLQFYNLPKWLSNPKLKGTFVKRVGDISAIVTFETPHEYDVDFTIPISFLKRYEKTATHKLTSIFL